MLKKIYRKLSHEINASVLVQLSKSEIQKQIEQAYKVGFNYHQKQIKKDIELQEWIIRENYFDNQ